MPKLTKPPTASIELANKAYAQAMRRTVVIQVRVNPAVRAWWRWRLFLAVQIARLAAWVGGTGLEIG